MGLQLNPFKSYLGLGVFRRAVRLIIYWKGSEDDRKESAWVSEHLTDYLKNGNENEKAIAQQYFEELWKRQEHSLSC